MSFLKNRFLTVCVLLLLTSVAVSEALLAAEQDAGSTERVKLEQKLEKQMSGATLVGHFSVDGKQNGKPPREERYEIASMKKLQGDQWLITARIKYGDNDVNVPMPLNVFWAGDTPVISLTEMTIPGLGTFTSRVMFFEGRYAGTWQHGKVGGNLWGKIEYADQKSESQEEKE